jgi:hypothetical protein
MNSGSEALANPYVGPRSLRFGETLYGREREVLALFDLLIAERIVLLYSPSGAGKTSLVQAALIPELMKEEFEVLPVMRVNAESPPELQGTPKRTSGTNRYVLSALSYLEKELPKDQQTPLPELAGIKFADYLDQGRIARGGGKPKALIFDQFEEVLTLDPTDRLAKEEFFSEVGTALRNRERWAVFVIREEYLAGLDPYLQPIPTRFGNTFRLEFLGRAAALKAVQEPARKARVDFTDSAANKLVDDLRRILVQQADGTVKPQAGLYVEPVQLQVVCSQLWEKKPRYPGQEIREEDIRDLGDVDSALGGYYADKVRSVAGEAKVKERFIREWFDRQLITDQGIRGQVPLGPESSAGLGNHAIWPLVNAYLVRSEKVRGATWFELAHDRLIEPIRKDNATWRDANLSPLQRQAQLWNRQNRPDHILLRDEKILKEQEQWASEHWDELTLTEKDFLAACQAARAAAKKEGQRKQLFRALVLVTVLSALLIFYWRYSVFIEDRPWGYFRSLSTGTVHRLRGDQASVGRTVKFKNTVNLRPRNISRIHLLLSRDLSAFDMRSLNGTTVNARFLEYGFTRKLADGDIIVLAGIAPFQFSEIEYSAFQFWTPSIPDAIPPSGWGMLIDGRSRSVKYLIKDRYFLSLDKENRFILTEEKVEGALLKIQRKGSENVAIEDLDDGVDLNATMKEGDYDFPTYKIPPGQEFSMFKTPREEHDIFEVAYSYNGVPFQIVPIISDLEPERPPTK